MHLETFSETGVVTLRNVWFLTWMERRAGRVCLRWSTPEGFRMSRKDRDQVHGLENVYEDLLLLGGSVWKASCVCGWTTRPCAQPGVAVGLVRRHGVITGR